MVCTNCGALIPEHAPACPSCARPMRVREVLESPPNLTAAHNDQYQGVGGWLGLLVFYLLVFLPLGTGMQLVRGVRPILAGESVQQAASLPNLTYWIVALLVTVIGIYAGIALWRVFRERNCGNQVLFGRFPGRGCCTRGLPKSNFERPFMGDGRFFDLLLSLVCVSNSFEASRQYVSAP